MTGCVMRSEQQARSRTGPVTLSSGWLRPPGTLAVGDASETGLVLMPAGILWDVVRTPLAIGSAVLGRLLADEHDSALVGPVLCDSSNGWLYWLVSPGADDTWPDDARLLGTGAWVVAPANACLPTQSAAWLHLPDDPIVSGPAWLAAALNDHVLFAA